MGKLNPQSKFSLSIKELIAGTLGISSLLAVFFSLQSEIALAKELPLPEITKVELSYKDELIKNDFKNMRDDIKYIKDYIIRNKK